jgi:hypothetical protein
VADNPALTAWAARAVHETLLPSGQWIRFRIPPADLLLRRGALPEDLLPIAQRFVGTGVEPQKLMPEEVADFISIARHLSAWSVVAVMDDAGAYQPVDMTADEVQVLSVDDQTALRSLALRQDTPAALTARVRRALGQLSAAAAARIEEEEAGATVTGYADFRGQRPGPAVGTDGADLRPESGAELSGPRGSGPGGRRRRGSGAAGAERQAGQRAGRRAAA